MWWRSWSRAGEQVRSGRPSENSHNGEFGFFPFVASVCGWDPQSHLILPSSQGLLTLGELLSKKMLVSGKCQTPSQISGQGLNHLPHQNSLGIEYSPEEWRAA